MPYFLTNRGLQRLTGLVRSFEEKPKYQRLFLLLLAFVYSLRLRSPRIVSADDYSPWSRVLGLRNGLDASGDTVNAKAINGVSLSNLYGAATLDDAG